MAILITTKWTYTEGPDVSFTCPNCGLDGATARTEGTEERNSLFWLIPLFTSRHTTLTCSACTKSTNLVMPLDEVQELDPEQITQHLQTSVPFLAKFCIVTSIALCLVPVVGLVFGGIGFWAAAKAATRWKRAAVIGMGLNLLFIACLGLMIAMGF